MNYREPGRIIKPIVIKTKKSFWCYLGFHSYEVDARRAELLWVCRNCPKVTEGHEYR